MVGKCGVGLPRTVFWFVTFPRGAQDLQPLGQGGQVIKEHALCGLLALAREWNISRVGTCLLTSER